MKNLKVAMLSPDRAGGICHYTHCLCEALDESSGLAVNLFTAVDYELKHIDVKFKRFHIYDSVYDSFLAKLLLRLLTFRPDVIHIQFPFRIENDIRVIKQLRKAGIKIVYTAHNVLPHERCDKDYDYFGQIYNLVDRIVVHSTNNRLELCSLFKIDESKIDVIPMGNFNIFNDFSSEIKIRRSQFGFTEEDVVFLFFGMIREYKGIEVLLESFNRLNCANAKLLIVGKLGKKYSEDRTFIDSLKKTNIHAVLEYIPNEEVKSYFELCDVAVLPYINTYQSAVLQLSYALSKLVVVTDVGGLAETVENGKSGFVVPPKDTEALKEANEIGGVCQTLGGHQVFLESDSH